MQIATRAGALYVLTSLALGACTDRVLLDGVVDDGQPDDEDEPEDDGPPPEDDDEPPPEDDDVPPPPDDDDEPPPVECVDIVMEPVVPSSLEGEFVQGPSRFQPSCVESVSAEVTFSFTAPRSATYIFDTAGSSFDTVLYAYGPACEGPELGCNDDSNGTLAASLGLSMVAGDTVILVLDSFGETGEWTLGVRETGTCPEIQLPPVPETVLEGFLDEGAEDSIVSSCGGSGGDVTHLWTPPFTGRFRFSTVGSDFDTVLSLHDESCAEITCNDDAQGDVTSLIDADMVEGVPVVVGIEAFDGAQTGFYQLAIFPN